MQKPFLAVLCLIAVSACTSPYGNHAKLTDSYNSQMADDGVHELTALYPPATTHIALLQPTEDAYGIELVKSLRESGYAIEQGGDANSAYDAANNAPMVTDNTEAPPAAILPIHYTVDSIGGALYRITISAEDQTINRVYSVNGDDMLPVGAWTRKQ